MMMGSLVVKSIDTLNAVKKVTLSISVAMVIFLGLYLDASLHTLAAAPSVNSHESEQGLFGVQRRRDQYGNDFAYVFAPLASTIPGYGTAYGAFSSVANIAGTDTDVVAFYLNGDFNAAGLTVLDLQIVPKRLVFDAGIFDYELAYNAFDRGIQSDEENYIRPEVKGNGTVAQLTFSSFERMFDLYGRYSTQSSRVLHIFDSDQNEFSNVDTNKNTYRVLSLGLNLDLTDDRLDPRRGLRFELVRKSLLNDVDPILSTFSIYDLNLSLFVPMGKSSVWAFNVYHSRAVLKSKGSTDRNELTQRFGLGCSSITDTSARADCDATEGKRIDEILANNTYGSASSLGGTQRLRSFVNGRFHAGNVIFYGTEFRWNLTQEERQVDWFILSGIHTNIQAAFYLEAGSVADKREDLHDKLLYSYGVGMRMVFSGAIMRLDVGHGSEGLQTQFFLDYPWSLFSVDKPS